MAGSGTMKAVISENALKGASQSALTKAMDNANEVAKSLDPKGVTKQPTVEQKKMK